MIPDTDRFHVLTGGPGSGKTTLVDALAAASHSTMVEAGRGIIRDQMAIDGPALPWRDPALFAELMLSWEMRSHAMASALPGPVFFDRGMPDVVGYLRLMGLPVPAHVEQAARGYRYAKTVFVLPHWPEIFTRDSERRQDEDEARRTHAGMVETYREFGYDLIEVPKAPVHVRLRFVLEQSQPA